MPLHDSDINAGAMMGFALWIQTAFAVLIGLFLGSVLTAVSVKLRPRLIGLGTAALLFNIIPLIAMIVFFSIKNKF